MISGDTDMRIFVDSHRSANHYLQKEDFQPYDQQRVDLIGRKSLKVRKNSLEEPKPMQIDDNYIASKS